MRKGFLATVRLTLFGGFPVVNGEHPGDSLKPRPVRPVEVVSLAPHIAAQAGRGEPLPKPSASRNGAEPRPRRPLVPAGQSEAAPDE